MSRVGAIRVFAVFALFTGLVLAGITAFACVPIAILRLTPAQQPAGELVPVPHLAPGAQMTAFIHEISGDGVPPVSFHWDGVDGPVLATAVPTQHDTSATITVPENATPGAHIIVATQPRQDATLGEYPTWGLPVKASLVVTGAGATAPRASSVAPGPIALSEGGVGVGLLVLIAIATVLVAAGLALAVAWVVRRPAPSQTPSSR